MLRARLMFLLSFVVCIGYYCNPSDNNSLNSIIVTNKLVFFEGTSLEDRVAISVYMDDVLKKESLAYSHSYKIESLSDGTYNFRFRQAPGESGIYNSHSDFAVSGGEQVEIVVKLDNFEGK